VEVSTKLINSTNIHKTNILILNPSVVNRVHLHPCLKMKPGTADGNLDEYFGSGCFEQKSWLLKKKMCCHLHFDFLGIYIIMTMYVSFSSFRIIFFM